MKALPSALRFVVSALVVGGAVGAQVVHEALYDYDAPWRLPIPLSSTLWFAGNVLTTQALVRVPGRFVFVNAIDLKLGY